MREIHELTQEELAEQLNLDVDTYRQYEDGETDIRKYSLRVANLLMLN